MARPASKQVCSACNGLAFSTLEENPWATSMEREGRTQDPGHGLELTFDLVRYESGLPREHGNASLHFGRTRDRDLVPITYDWPGGAHGTMESRTFSLAGYSAADKPVLYFNYFAATEQESSDPATRRPCSTALRVYIGDASGRWDMLGHQRLVRRARPRPADRTRIRSRKSTTSTTAGGRCAWNWTTTRALTTCRFRIDFATAGDDE